GLDYRGRLDHQVKIRGFRIELGEIEAALMDHLQVREAVVMARGQGEQRRLVAYLATTGDVPPTVSALRRFLQEQLPDHMVPSAFMVLDSLPLTENGKVDRQALSEPEAARPALAA